MNDQEMIAVPLNDLLSPLCQCIERLCECVRKSSNQTPPQAIPFFFRGSVSQTFVCHQASNVFQVPPGMTGTITQIKLAERYPGTLYGAAFMLLINNNLDPRFPRVDHPIGTGMETGLSVNIELEEQDTVAVLIQCSWTPVQFTGMASTYVQTLFPFEISGYYEYKQVA